MALTVLGILLSRCLTWELHCNRPYHTLLLTLLGATAERHSVSSCVASPCLAIALCSEVTAYQPHVSQR